MELRRPRNPSGQAHATGWLCRGWPPAAKECQRKCIQNVWQILPSHLHFVLWEPASGRSAGGSAASRLEACIKNLEPGMRRVSYPQTETWLPEGSPIPLVCSISFDTSGGRRAPPPEHGQVSVAMATYKIPVSKTTRENIIHRMEVSLKKV